MKREIIVTVFLIMSLVVFSQETPSNKSLKVYTSYNWAAFYNQADTSLQPGVTIMNYEREIGVFNFSPSFVIHNSKGNSHEFELTRVFYQNNYQKTYDEIDSTGNVANIVSGELIKQFQLHLRYEYVWSLFKQKDWKKLNGFLGFSASPFYKWNKQEPLTSMSYTKSEKSMGLYFSVIPRVQYNINKRLYLDLNFPIALLTAQYTTQFSDNPALAINERQQSTIDIEQLPFGFAVRIGMGFRM